MASSVKWSFTPSLVQPNSRTPSRPSAASTAFRSATKAARFALPTVLAAGSVTASGAPPSNVTYNVWSVATTGEATEPPVTWTSP